MLRAWNLIPGNGSLYALPLAQEIIELIVRVRVNIGHRVYYGGNRSSSSSVPTGNEPAPRTDAIAHGTLAQIAERLPRACRHFC